MRVLESVGVAVGGNEAGLFKGDVVVIDKEFGPFERIFLDQGEFQFELRGFSPGNGNTISVRIDKIVTQGKGF